MYRKIMRKPEGKKPLGRPDGWIIVKWILEGWDGMDWDGVVWTGLMGLRIGSIGRLL
jgi:hypothetical protein